MRSSVLMASGSSLRPPKTARLWDAETGKQIGEALRGHGGMVTSAAFSPMASAFLLRPTTRRSHAPIADQKARTRARSQGMAQ